MSGLRRLGRIKNGHDGFAYMHDKYVEMPNKSGPAQNGIISCGDKPSAPIISSDGRRVTVKGKVRQYVPFGQATGAGTTVANVRLEVRRANRVSFAAPHMNTTDAADDLGFDTMTWTTKVL